MKKRLLLSTWLLAWVLLAVFAPAGTPAASAQSPSAPILYLEASGPLTPAMHEYLKRGLRSAGDQQAQALIFQLNTPGGDVMLMSQMIQEIRSSPVPVVVYVAPRGGMAASAGTLLTLAGHLAAMAPETTIGAASPVGGQGEDLGETEAAKLRNTFKATVRALAAHRGQEAVAFAERTIEEADAASASEALEMGVIDLIATSRQDLLAQLEGRSVQTASGSFTLHTSGVEVIQFESSFIERLLAALTNPNIVFLLIAVGIQAILIEISNPGGWIAGFLGVVCLALASYGLGVLPVNWFGIIFLITAFVLFILDIKAPTHGALTAAGVGSLITGALVLFNSPNVPDFQRVSVPLVIGSSVITGVMFFLLVMLALRAQKLPVRMGQESLLGRKGWVQVDLDPEGIVQLAGEQWSALAEGGGPLLRGAAVQVVRVEGLKLIVCPAGSLDAAPGEVS